MSTSQSRPPQQLFNRKKRQRIQYEFSLNRYFPPFKIQLRQNSILHEREKHFRSLLTSVRL